MKKTLLLVAIAFMSISSFSQIIYVNQLASGSNNGTSWSNAFNSLKTALANAGTNSTIWVAAGTYKPYTSSRSDYFNINLSDLKIYGGFAGNETALSQRIFGSNETILSGDVSGNDSGSPGYTNSSYSDNCYQVIYISSGGQNATLDRLTIKGGFANGSSGQDIGAGIYMTSTSNTLTLENCKITKNVSKTGGAFSVASPCTININACEFTENVAGYGAGMYVGTFANINISNSLFANNKAVNTVGSNGYAGSALWIANYTGSIIYTKLHNCTFANNSDQGTYTGMTNANRTPVVLSRAVSNYQHNAEIYNCVFWGNTNPGGVSPAISKANDNIPANNIWVLNTTDESSLTGVTLASGSGNNDNSNPLFMNAAAGDFQLTASSPAINTGTNSGVLGSVDLLNNQRIYNSIVDKGAYEYGSTPTNITNLNKLNNINLFPNPSSSNITIQTANEIQAAYIFNTLGDLVRTENSKTFSVEKLASGIYIMHVKTETGISKIRFVKE